MKAEKINISQISLNESNPRFITETSFTKLVNSILVFPKMMEIRPIAIDEQMVAIGGNMRYRALMRIAVMTEQEITEQLQQVSAFQKKTDAEKEAIISYWLSWQDNPLADIVRVNKLTDEEKKEFIIKDNVGFGSWDFDVLANEWDSEDLEEWGIELKKYENVEIDSFFDETENTSSDSLKKITLHYSEEDYNKIIEAFSSLNGSKEDILFNLLGCKNL